MMATATAEKEVFSVSVVVDDVAQQLLSSSRSPPEELLRLVAVLGQPFPGNDAGTGNYHTPLFA